MPEPITLKQSAAKNVAEDVAGATVIAQGLQSAEHILVELLRAGAANPIIAASSMIIISDILAQNKIISQTASDNINLLIEALTAATVLTDVFKSGVSTLVYGAQEAGKTADTLLPLLALLPK